MRAPPAAGQVNWGAVVGMLVPAASNAHYHITKGKGKELRELGNLAVRGMGWNIPAFRDCSMGAQEHGSVIILCSKN